MGRKARIVAAMSGGVDSSVAAGLLLEDGWEVIGVTLRVLSCAEDGSGTSAGRRCCASQDVADARRVAETLGIEHHVIDAREEFRAGVLDPFVESYAAGMTPLPCAACNHAVKFGLLLDRAAAAGAEGVATGHYARVERAAGEARLKRARDEERDQTYFLYGVPRERLNRAWFPLGGMTKGEVRSLARRWNLPVAGKPDSQEICFIPDGDAGAFLDGILGMKPGPIVDADGRVLGEHGGIHRFTVGQRRGLGLGGPEALHVIALRAETNTVVAGPEEKLYASGCVVRDFNELDPGWRGDGVAVRIRSRHAPAPCAVRDGEAGGVRIEFAAPQRSVAPGQAAVLYRGDEVLGGGTIVKADLTSGRRAI